MYRPRFTQMFVSLQAMASFFTLSKFKVSVLMRIVSHNLQYVRKTVTVLPIAVITRGRYLRKLKCL